MELEQLASVLPAHLVRPLGDHHYDKRKAAAREVQDLVKTWNHGQAEQADVMAFQETGAGQDDDTWRREMETAVREAAESPSSHARCASSHQSGSGRWVGGVAQVVVGEAVAKASSRDDVRGWGRYGVTILQGKGGRKLAVVNVYIRNDAPGAGEGDHKLSQDRAG